MPDEYCHGEYSQWENAKRCGPSGGSAEVSQMMPEGWGSAGETRSDTIRRNAIEGLWLPLFITPGCDGHKGALDPVTGIPLPEVIYYAANHVDSMMTQKFGAAHSSDDADNNRYAMAVELANDASHNTSGGGPNVRENA